MIFYEYHRIYNFIIEYLKKKIWINEYKKNDFVSKTATKRDRLKKNSIFKFS